MAWVKFKTLFLSAINSVAPARSVRIRQRSQPWFNSEVFEAIRARDKAMSKHKRTGDPADFSQYKACRNKAQLIIKESKITYFSEQILFWKVLKNRGCLSKTKSTPSSWITLSIDGKEVNKKEDIANHFNAYFTSVAHKLVRSYHSAQDCTGLNTFRIFMRS